MATTTFSVETLMVLKIYVSFECIFVASNFCEGIKPSMQHIACSRKVDDSYN